MKQVIQNYKSGRLSVEEVPMPVIKPGGVLVRNAFSLISAGTERARVELARKSLLGKARSRPDQVREVIKAIKRQGILNTYRIVRNRLDLSSPLGYSSAGIVIEVGEGVDEFKVGDRVACAGGGYANHAEVVFVPKNLCAKVSDNVSLEYAAFTTLGAIALQGIRQADIKLGESVAVIGLGLLGQLTAQMLKSSGCKVVGLDIDDWKVDLAKNLGADLAFNVRISHLISHISHFTSGYGVDAVIITAATDSNEPFLLAPEITRDRGRVVLVGVARIDFPREPYYRKELSVILSRSYGPGRYDALYEEKGVDYPIGYVRWTEKRNMEAFLQFLGSGRLTLDPLITHRFKIDDAIKAYGLILGKKKEKYLGILLEYPRGEVSSKQYAVSSPREIRLRISRDKYAPLPTSYSLLHTASVGFIGAGNFAQNFLLPNLKKVKEINFIGIADADSLTASHIGKKYGFEYCTSDYNDLLTDPTINTIFIATRHNLHAKIIIESLKAGKNVFCEKPLCLNQSELEEIVRSREKGVGSKEYGVSNKEKGVGSKEYGVSREGNKNSITQLPNNLMTPILMIGYNRRFAPLTQVVKNFFTQCTTPYAITYRINAGSIPKDHWIQDPEEGGGRIIGEVCHFIDLIQYFTQSLPNRVFAEAIENDTLNINLKFNDGSIATINYLANGDPGLPKERVEIFNSGSVAIIEDFKKAIFFINEKKKEVKKLSKDKGYFNELKAFVEAIKEGKGSPIKFEEIVYTSLTTFKIIESLNRGIPIRIEV